MKREFLIIGEGGLLRALELIRAILRDGYQVMLTVEKYEGKATPAQKRLWWALMGEISDQANVGGRTFTKDSWAYQMKREFLQCAEYRLPSGRLVIEPPSINDISKAEMTELIDKAMAYAIHNHDVRFNVKGEYA